MSQLSQVTAKTTPALPNDILLYLIPYLSVSSLVQLSRVNCLFRFLFWKEEDVKAFCFARNFSRPLSEMGVADPKPRCPDDRTLASALHNHLERGCNLRACHDALSKSTRRCLGERFQ